MKRTIRGISRCLKTTVAQLFLGLDQAISYATLNRFWHQLASVAEQVFLADVTFDYITFQKEMMDEQIFPSSFIIHETRINYYLSSMGYKSS